jgi:2-polyprenyl-3-methyl-5-hydroxy-6-metoxy-1,4-benzoquinol methylase
METLSSKHPVTAAEATFPAKNNFAETLGVCPLCSGVSFRRLPTPGHWIGQESFSSGADAFGLCRCEKCSLTFVNPRPTSTLLDAFYNCDSYVCHEPEGGSFQTAHFLLECVARYGPYQGKRFLDFGCGGGFLLRAALHDKWSAFGYDVGKRALDSCNAQGLAVTGNMDEFASSSFDVVLLNHVFEHLAEPKKVLSRCQRVLDATGKLFVVVPNLAGMRAKLSFPLLSRHFGVDERHRAFPIHLFYFTPRTLTQTLEQNGFRVTAMETFGLGLDEFFNRPDQHIAKSSNSDMRSPAARHRRALREIVKKKFFGAGLGENLIAVAEPNLALACRT